MLPHDTWAEVYDEAYERVFGEVYPSLTRQTLSLLAELAPPAGRIIDFGAGTGRLSIPLAQDGYDVVAVEPSRAMGAVLLRKAAAAGVSVALLTQTMQHGPVESPADLAICVFTVLIYITEEEGLRMAFEAAARSIKPGGRFLFDLPSRAIFHDFHYEDAAILRTVAVIPAGGQTFRYEERIRTAAEGSWLEYRDAFTIRAWREDEVFAAAAAAGFVVEHEVTARMPRAGSRYFLARLTAMQ